MLADALSWFHSIGSYWFWLLAAAVAVVLLIWLLVEMADRRDERRAEEEAEAEWNVQRESWNKAQTERERVLRKPEPVAPVADEIIKRLRKRDARTTPLTRAKKTNSRRKVARHK
jgi:flagellar biosynthesis/type III secretory pathway M-ring protein FliF/YscJ